MTTKFVSFPKFCSTVRINTYMILSLHFGSNPSLNWSLFKWQKDLCFFVFLTYCFFISLFMILEGKKGERFQWLFFQHMWLKLSVGRYWKYNKDKNKYEKMVDEAGQGAGAGLYPPMGCLWKRRIMSGVKFSEVKRP